MRIQYLLAVAGLSVLLAAPAMAQDPIKKVGDQTHHVLKKTGNAVKQGAKDVGSATHHTLKKAGNATKAELGDATGIHTVGGEVGKAARSVSHTSKTVSAKAKHGVKKHASKAHNDLTAAGKDAKAEVKKP
jgi:gas vesicle protein